jgi:hypothetical protein
MHWKTKGIVALGIGGFLSLPLSAVLFNFFAEAVIPLSALVCDEPLLVKPSFRNHSHTYLCGGVDVTLKASVLLWIAFVLVLALMIFLLLPSDKDEAA